MYKGYKQLTKAERQHLSEHKVCNTYQLEDMLTRQAMLRPLGGSDPCFACKGIAKQLGYPVELAGGTEKAFSLAPVV